MYYVEWVDAQHFGGWHTLAEVSDWSAQDDWLIYQAGYLIDQSKDHLVLAGKYNPQEADEDRFSELTRIPAAWIKRKRRLSISV